MKIIALIFVFTVNTLASLAQPCDGVILFSFSFDNKTTWANDSINVDQNKQKISIKQKDTVFLIETLQLDGSTSFSTFDKYFTIERGCAPKAKIQLVKMDITKSLVVDSMIIEINKICTSTLVLNIQYLPGDFEIEVCEPIGKGKYPTAWVVKKDFPKISIMPPPNENIKSDMDITPKDWEKVRKIKSKKKN